MYYFAYGSNMLSSRLARRVPSLVPLGAARLPGHELRFDLRGSDGSGKCNVVVAANPSAIVHGVVYQLDADRLERLHAAEGPAYEFVQLPVQLHDERVSAAVYRGRAKARVQGLRPFAWYLRFVVGGAREHGLPTAYVRRLAAVPTRRDHNLWRAWRNWRIYRHRPAPSQLRGG
ncbi:MAG TPA: gamma-glutamylcyclotransferase family protein [Salinisphaeraceae bacterium]|nr:gamma-glutamylcyclotransferase family protein [Salinisphaeraceae bacterium]